MNSSILEIVLKARDEASSQLKTFEGNIKNMESSLSKVRNTGLVAFGAISAVIGKTVSDYAEAEKEMSIYNTTMDSMIGKVFNVATGFTKTTTTIKMNSEEIAKNNLEIKENNIKIAELGLRFGELNEKYSKGKISLAEYNLEKEKLNINISKLNSENVKLQGEMTATDSKVVSLTRSIKLTAEEVEKAKKKFMEVAQENKKYAFDNEESVSSLGRLYQATGNQTKALELNKLAMNFSAQSGKSLSESTDVMLKVLAGSGARALKEYGVEIDKNASSTEIFAILQEKTKGQYEAQANTIAGQTKILKNSLGDLSENIGQSLAPQIKKLLDVVTPFLEKAGAWVANHSELVGKVLLVGGAVAGLIVGIGALGLVIGPLLAGFSAISTAFVFLAGIVPILGSAITVLGGALAFVAASPIVLIIGALAALTGAIVWSIYHWDLIQATVTKVLNYLDPYIQKVTNIIMTTIKNWIDNIYNLFNVGFTKVKDFIIGIFDSIKSTIQSATDWITSKVQPIIDGFINSYNRLSGLIGGAVTSTTSLFSGKKASGGDVYSGNSYLVGENGPELFTPNSTGKIIPNGGGGGIQIILTGNTFMGKEDVAKQIANELADQLKFQLRY